MHSLTSLHWWALLLLTTTVAVVAAIGARLVVARTQGDAGDESVRHAGPLMPALGVLFAFLSGFVITTEWTQQSQTESVVQHVASASARLAWASTAPGVQTARIQDSLARDLTATITVDWSELKADRTRDVILTDQFRDLESAVRLSATAPGVATPAGTELLASIDELAAARRDLASSASRNLPTLLFAALAISGLALIANAATLTIRSRRRTMLVISSIVAIVAVDLTVLLVLAAPFRGTQTISPAPIEQVAAQIDAGWFHLQ